MHIVFVTTELATSKNSSGGLASFTANMAHIFANHGHKVTIVVAAVKEEELQLDTNIEVIATYIEKEVWEKYDKVARFLTLMNKGQRDEVRRFFVNLHKSRQIQRKIAIINSNEKIDVIHYCNHGAVALRAGKRIPYVIRISSFLNINRDANLPNGSIEYKRSDLSIKDRLAEFTLKKSRYNISPSNIVAKNAKQYLKVETTVIESPFVLNSHSWNYDYYNELAKGKTYIIHFGSLKYLKGTHVVAELAKKFLGKYKDIDIVLAGNSEIMFDKEGNEIKAHELVKKCAGPYADRVVYVGRLVREQLYPFIKNAELCLLPSRIENLSNACIEAMAMGKIVVATNGASYEQLIEDGFSGFLRERDNPESFFEGIERVLSLSEKEKEVISENAKRTVERLNPDIIYEKYLAYYQKVIREW